MTELAQATVHGNYIGGEWRPPAPPGETYRKTNPMHPAQCTGEFASSSAVDADTAVVAAQEASLEWAALPLAKRGGYLEVAAEILTGRAEEIARDISSEMGKPLREARG